MSLDTWPQEDQPRETNFEKTIKEELGGNKKGIQENYQAETVGEKPEDVKLFDFLLKGQKNGIKDLNGNPMDSRRDERFTLQEVINGVRALQGRVQSGTNKAEDLKFTLEALDKFVNGKSTQEQDDALFGMAKFAKESKS